MLTAVIIILREFLEAALLISLLSVLHLKLLANRNWIFAAIFFGIASAFLYARSFAAISEWFDGSGQEMVNGLSLLCISLCLAIQIIGLTIFYRDRATSSNKNNTRGLMILTMSATLIIIMAIAREGAEIFVYYSGINIQPEKASSMLIGGVIGAGLGICTGMLTFVLLYQLSIKNLVITTTILLIAMTAGIMSESIRSFIQAGLIITGEPVWNSSQLIPEPSVVGQLLYAIFAYEATPTREEILVWLLSVLSLSCLLVWIHFRKQLTPGK
jgi:high-affinity iron transporter